MFNLIIQVLIKSFYYFFCLSIGYLKRSISLCVHQNSKNMLLVNLSAAEIQQLKYERFHYPCPIIQKRIHAVYLKATLGLSDTKIGQMVGLHRHSVSHWVNRYKNQGFESLCKLLIT